VLEQRKARERREQEEERLERERAARRRLGVIAVIAVAVAAVMGAVVLWALGQRDAARNASLMAGARELLARDQPGPATRLLLEVKEPERVRGWVGLAWDTLASGSPEVMLQRHEGSLGSAAWSPDGRRIVTASMDKTARVWKAETIVLKGHESWIMSAPASPDGRRIVLASNDETARVWSIPAPALQPHLRAATTDCLSFEMRRTYLDESDTDARAGYEDCERSHGRIPFYPDAAIRP
jgi:WD40 repeat protein